MKRYIYFLVDDLTTSLPLKIVGPEHLSASKEALEKLIEEILWHRGLLEIKGALDVSSSQGKAGKRHVPILRLFVCIKLVPCFRGLIAHHQEKERHPFPLLFSL